MNHHVIFNFTLAGLVITMAVIDFIVTVRWEKRWRKRLQESAEQTMKLFAEKSRLEMELDRKDAANKKLEADLTETKAKLKKAHEKVAMLMVEYERLTKKK